MWTPGNFSYLFGLFLIALILAVVRMGLTILSRYLGAAAVLEAVTRLRRPVYHHTNRLGTLAFRALGPSRGGQRFDPPSRSGARRAAPLADRLLPRAGQVRPAAGFHLR